MKLLSKAAAVLIAFTLAFTMMPGIGFSFAADQSADVELENSIIVNESQVQESDSNELDSGLNESTEPDARTEKRGEETSVCTVEKSMVFGTIDGDDEISQDEIKEYEINISNGHRIAKIFLNGVSVPRTNSYVQTLTLKFDGENIILNPESKDESIIKMIPCEDSKLVIRVTSYTDEFTIKSSISSVIGDSSTASPLKGGSITASKTVKYGDSATFSIKPGDGFKIKSVLVDGENVGAVSSYTFEKVTKTHTIKAVFKKTSFFIMLDAGHYGKWNRYNIPGVYYYESQMAWKLHNYLKESLEEYRNVVVNQTRANIDVVVDPYDRGLKAKGHDLFISLHSNAVDNAPAVDYPLVIKQYKATKKQTQLAVNMAECLYKTIGTVQRPQVWERTLSSSSTLNWDGVLRGSKKVNCNGILIEHSFHTNRHAAKWLYSEKNLKKLAQEEAAVIAEHYGLVKKDGTEQDNEPAPAPAPADTLKVPCKVKTTDELNVRSKPGTDGTIKGVIPKGAVYSIVRLSAGKKWGKLSCSNGGWVCLKYVKFVTGRVSDVKPYKIRSTIKGLNVRKGPGTSYDITSHIYSTTKYYTIDRESKTGKWGRLKGTTRWVSLAYVKRSY